MSCSRSNSVAWHDGHSNPAGTNSPSGRSYQASAPSRSNTFAARSINSGVSVATPHCLQVTAGIGTPHDRCREMHQSGLPSNMPFIRSPPHAGNHRTASTSAIALARSPVSSMLMNHCEVARKITGLWQRQQCGYE